MALGMDGTSNYTASKPLCFSVVTPTLNQGAFIDQTIRSVAGQGYPHYEHIIIDGGSTDGTIDRLKAYPHLKWTSEVDAGQADALNKCFRQAKGDIIAWINSDDWYEPTTFEAVAVFFSRHPDKHIVMGNCRLVDETGQLFDTVINHERGFEELKRYWVSRSIPTQPAVFFRRKLLADFGLLDPSLHYAMDYDLWLRFAQRHRFYHLDQVVANYRFHRAAKGGDQNWSRFLPEWKRVARRYPRSGLPLVTVVVPCYNYGHYLAEALNSVVAQTYRRFEIIIINDGSTDHTAEVVDEFIRNHPNFPAHLICQPNSGQPAISRNKAIEQAAGAFILPLDADDALAPGMIAACVDLLEKNRDVAIAYTDRQDFGGSAQVVPAGDYDFHRLKYANQISYCALFRKKVWTEVGGFRTNVKGLEDWDFWIAAGCRGFTGRRIPRPLFRYRRHHTGLYQEALKDFRTKFAQIVLNNREAYPAEDIQRAETVLKSGGRVAPEVSVIVPTFNRPRMLAVAIESILKQTFGNFEIIVVNDAGEDVSNVIARFDDSRIRYLPQSQNRGLAAARNAGIRQAEGTYIALLDDDDCFYPEHLETALETLHAGISVVYTDAVRAVYVPTEDGYQLQRKHVPYSIDFDRSKLLIGNIAPVNCFVFERNMALQAGLFDETFHVLEDWDFWIRLAAVAPFQHVRKPTVEVRWRTDGSTMTSSRRHAFERCRKRIYKRYHAEIMAIPNRDRIIDDFEAIWRQDAPAPSDAENPQRRSQPGLVSIIILTFNQLQHTRTCLESIRRCTPEDHEIILVDNGSTDGTVDFLHKVAAQDDRCRLIENDRNLGFAAGNNIGLYESRGDYLVLMNNDVVVTPGWLSRLIAHAAVSRSTGIVGPKSNETSGPQRVNSVRYQPQTLEGLDEFACKISNQYSGKSLSHWKVVGFCMLIKRAVIERIGGLDPRFGIGNFEDDDFCLRAYLAGFKCRIAVDCFVHHSGSASFRAAGFDYDALLRKNWEIFKQKWNISADTALRREYTIPLKRLSFDPAKHFIAFDAFGGFRREAVKAAGDNAAAFSNDDAKIPVKLHSDENHIDNGGPSVNSYEKMYDGLRVLVTSSRPEDALSALRNVVGSFPDFARVHNDMGAIYYRTGDTQKALGHLQRAVQLDPSDPQFQKDLGDLYYVALKNTESALGCYAEVLKRRPGDAETLMLTAHILVSLRRFHEAQIHYQRVLAAEPWNTQAKDNLEKLRKIDDRSSESNNSSARYQKIQPLIQDSERRHEAIRQLEALLTDYPGFALAHNDLGVLCYQAGQPEKALRHYEEAARLQPENITFQKNMADFYYVEQKRTEEALRVYLRLLENDAADFEVLMALGQICQDLHKHDDARAFYERVLEIEPWNSIARDYVDGLDSSGKETASPSTPAAMHAQAVQLASSGDDSEAALILERLLKSYPGFALAHNDLGVIAYRSGDKHKAIEHYENAARLEPGNTTFRKNLGDCYWVGFGRAEDAMKVYVDILKTDPGDIETLLATGRLCQSIGNPGDARFFFERSLEIEPWNTEAQMQLEQAGSAATAA